MSVTAAAGFSAGGVACGIKPGGVPDIALVAAEDGPVPAAATFTRNRASAAPVQVSREHLRASRGRARAVVLNSGNANAATGAAGRRNALRMAELTATGLGCRAEKVLVCSTGLIGYPLPMEEVEKGIEAVLRVADSTAGGGAAAARAIMTTDTVPKTVELNGAGCTVGGIAKGAAMLAPDMATMLAVLTTDAAVEPDRLRELLRTAVDESFNRLSVDGCTSTNDTVILLASGRAGPVDADALGGLLVDACSDLAAQMAVDAEGATRVAVITVTGARDDADARAGARKVAESQLVQCSIHGSDPYWGRVVSELGTAGIAFDLDRVSISYGGVEVCRDGVAADHDRAAVAGHMAGARIDIHADLGLGPGSAGMLTTALSPTYIAENERTS